VAPVPALATDAVLLAERLHTDPEAVMAAEGNGAIAISLVPDEALHPVLLVTVTERDTEPDRAAV